MVNSSAQKKLLAKKGLSMKRAVDITTAAEMAVLDQQQGVPMSDQTKVHSVSFTKLFCHCCGKRGHTANKCRFCHEVCFKCRKHSGHVPF